MSVIAHLILWRTFALFLNEFDTVLPIRADCPRPPVHCTAITKPMISSSPEIGGTTPPQTLVRSQFNRVPLCDNGIRIDQWEQSSILSCHGSYQIQGLLCSKVDRDKEAYWTWMRVVDTDIFVIVLSSYVRINQIRDCKTISLLINLIGK